MPIILHTVPGYKTPDRGRRDEGPAAPRVPRGGAQQI